LSRPSRPRCITSPSCSTISPTVKTRPKSPSRASLRNSSSEHELSSARTPTLGTVPVRGKCFNVYENAPHRLRPPQPHMNFSNEGLLTRVLRIT
jgi:hypothetical protein